MNYVNSSQKPEYKCPVNTWKMFNILSHQRNANDNYFEIPPYPIKMATKKMDMGKEEPLFSDDKNVDLPSNYRNKNVGSSKTSKQTNLKTELLWYGAIPVMGKSSKETRHKNLHFCIYRYTIYNSQ